MITRGHLIGFIVDNLTELGLRIENRCSLGLTDLNVHVENFFRPILSDCFECTLVNLNKDNANNPGLDLGDKKKGLAFQVTSTATSAKIVETLKKLPDESKATYKDIYVLIVGGKQGKYTLDDSEVKRTGFDKERIIDLKDVCRSLMFADLDVVERVHDHVKRDMRRVSIELEIPDREGNYETTMAKFMEAIPRVRMGTAEALHADMLAEGIWKVPSRENLLEKLTAFSAALQKLPRITRDFYVSLMERRETKTHHDNYFVSADKLSRFASGYDWEGEIRILADEGFVYIHESDDYPPQSAKIVICFPVLTEGVDQSLFDFVLRNSISLQKVFVSLYAASPPH